MVFKQTIDVTLDNVGVVVRALVAGIRTEADPQKVVCLVKHMRSFHDLLLLQPYGNTQESTYLAEEPVHHQPEEFNGYGHHLEQQNYQAQDYLYQQGQGQEYCTTYEQQQQYQEEEAFYQSFNEQQPEGVMQHQDDYMGLLATDPHDNDHNYLQCYNNNGEQPLGNSPYDYSQQQQQPFDSQLAGYHNYAIDLASHDYNLGDDNNDNQQAYDYYASQQMYYQ